MDFEVDSDHLDNLYILEISKITEQVLNSNGATGDRRKRSTYSPSLSYSYDLSCPFESPAFLDQCGKLTFLVHCLHKLPRSINIYYIHYINYACTMYVVRCIRTIVRIIYIIYIILIYSTSSKLLVILRNARRLCLHANIKLCNCTVIITRKREHLMSSFSSKPFLCFGVFFSEILRTFWPKIQHHEEALSHP